MEVNTVMGKNENSPFRQYINHKWFEHKKEVLTWENKIVDYPQEKWLEKNRWFLKRLWKSEN